MSSRTLFLFLYAFICLASLSCSSQSQESYREEGRALSKTLTEELQLIHTRDELIKKSPRLEELFNKIVDLIISAQNYHNSNAQSRPIPLSKKDRITSDKLRAEIARLYTIPGARKIFENIQRPALNKLDFHERQWSKKKNQDIPLVFQDLDLRTSKF